MIKLMLIYLAEVSVALAIFYSFYYLFLRKQVTYQWNRIYLLLSYLMSFIVPAISLKVYPIYITTQYGAPSGRPLAENTDAGLLTSEMMITLLGIAFLAGVAVLLIRFLINLYSIIDLINKSEKKVEDRYTLITHDKDHLTYSWFRYLFTDEVKPSQAILEHEQVHIDEWHTIDLIMAEIVKIILWFNPFVYLTQKSIKLNHEYICDFKASEKLGVLSYAKSLATYPETHHLSLYNNFAYKLKNRIIMLQQTSKSRNFTIYLLVLPMFVGLLTLFSFETYPVSTELGEAQPIVLDTLPDDGYYIDTIVTFNPETYEEKVQIVRTKKNKDGISYRQGRIAQKPVSPSESVDTIIVYNPETMEERMEIVKKNKKIEDYEQTIRESKSRTGIDTVVVFNPETGKKDTVVVRLSSAI